MLTCLNDKAGLGKTCEDRYPVGVAASWYLTKPNFYFPNSAALADRDTVLAAAAAGNILIIHKIKEVEPEDVDDGVNETSLGDKIFSFEGKRGGIYSFLQPIESHKFMRSLNGMTFGVIKVDINKALVFTELDDGRVTGVGLDYFRVKRYNTESADQVPMTRIQIQESDPDDIDRYGYYLNPAWNPLKLYGPNKVQIINSTVAANLFTSTVKYVNEGKKDSAGLPIEQAITGLLADNFYIEDEDGVVLVPGVDFTATEQGVTGIYDIDATIGTILSGSNRVIASITAMYASEDTELEAA